MINPDDPYDTPQFCPECGEEKGATAEAERLYAKNKQLRGTAMKRAEFCQWRDDKDPAYWTTGCGGDLDRDAEHWSDREIKWCPFCGGEIYPWDGDPTDAELGTYDESLADSAKVRNDPTNPNAARPR